MRTFGGTTARLTANKRKRIQTLAQNSGSPSALTSAGSEDMSVCRRSQHAALGRSPAAPGTPPGGGSAPPQIAAVT